MSYIFKGRLQGYICEECLEYLSNVIVRLYNPRDVDTVPTMVAGNPKDTFTVLKEKEISEKSQYLIAEVKTDDNGFFSFELDERQNYNGKAFEIDVYLDDIPNRKETKEKPEPVQLSITTLQPLWNQNENGFFWGWEYIIPYRFWCGIRALFGSWVICGRVVDCKTKRPIRGVKVFAFDVDLIQDDPLGNALTDANGYFRIYYSRAAFSKTVFSWLNIEWPAGPDVYFRIESNTSPAVVYLNESRNEGAKPARNNIGPCFCVTLCFDSQDFPDNPGGYVPALFTHVGSYDINTQFDAEGFTNDSQKNAFTKTIPLKGILPGSNASNEMEYRFRIINLNTSTELSPAQVNSLIPDTIIGSVIRHFPHDPSVPGSLPVIGYYRTDPFWLKRPSAAPYNVDPDAGGWIKVPRINDINGAGIFQASHPNIALAHIDTLGLVNESFDLTDGVPHKAGNKMSAADRFAGPNHVYQIIFEAREVGSVALSSSNVLTRIVLWNGLFKQLRHPSWHGGEVTLKSAAMVDIGEIAGEGLGCNKITNQVTALYTAYHPYIEAVSMIIEGPTGDFGALSPPIDADRESSGNHVYDFTARPSCAYILNLHVTYRLTSGYGRNVDAYDHDKIAFCKS